MSTAKEGLTLADMIRDVLLAMGSSQNEANKTFIANIEELAGTDVTIGYTKSVEGKIEKRELKGNALSFGVLPTLLSIQSGTIEIRTALSAAKNTQTAQTKNVNQCAAYLIKTNAVDAKYQNTYNYRAESSSVIRLTVVPTPPSQELLSSINSLTQKSPIIDKPKS